MRKFSFVRFSIIRLFVLNALIRIKIVYSFTCIKFVFIYLYQIRVLAFLIIIYDENIHDGIKFVYSFIRIKFVYIYNSFICLFISNVSFIRIKLFVYSYQTICLFVSIIQLKVALTVLLQWCIVGCGEQQNG